jgi:Mrp family chromosome partitioning ATPase
VVRSNIPGVWLLPGGKELEDSTLLLGQKFPGILAQLRKKADLVIVDGSPLLSGSDALLLATMVDGVALVLDSRHDKLRLILRTKDMLSSLIHTPSGVILNRMPRRKRNSYFASTASSVSTPEKRMPVTTYAIANNGNGNGYGDLSGHERRGAQVAPLNSIAQPVQPSAPVNGTSMPPELSMYQQPPQNGANVYPNPLSPQNGANVYPNPPSSRSLLHGTALSKPRNV